MQYLYVSHRLVSILHQEAAVPWIFGKMLNSFLPYRRECSTWNIDYPQSLFALDKGNSILIELPVMDVERL